MVAATSRKHVQIPSIKPSGDSPRSPKAFVKPRKSTIVEKVRQKYIYTELKSECCRLLLVNPREDQGERIDVTLTEVPFADLGKEQLKYKALSYHWNGTLTDTEVKPIHIRNDSNRLQARDSVAPEAAESANAAQLSQLSNVVASLTTKTLFVKPNLYYALRNLRRERKHVTLWVDALCINQDDFEEKQYQVSRMNDIYSKAESVIVWLGEGDERTKRAMSFIPEVIDLPGLNDLVADEARMDDWSDLIHLMRRSWFSRRWVIQELALASDAVVYCGSDKISWADFRDAVSLFAHEFDKIRPLFKRSARYDNDFYAIGDLDPLGAKVLVDAINNIFRKNKRGPPHEPIQGLEYLVSTLSSFQTGDPRDTIHCFNNIAKETCSPRKGRRSTATDRPPVPNYKKTLLQVYTDFVSWVANTTGSIDILCRHWAIPEKRDRDDNYPQLSALPSWIQQISEAPRGRHQKGPRDRVDGDSFVGMPNQRVYDACNGKSADIRFTGDRVSSDRSNRGGNKVGTPKEMCTTTQAGATDSGQAGSSQTAGPSNGESRKRPREGDHEDIGQGAQKVQRTDTAATASSAAQTKNVGASKTTQTEHDHGSESDSSSQSEVSRGSSASSSAMSDEFEKAEAMVVAQLLDHHRDASMYVSGIKVGTINYCTEPIPDGVIPSKAMRKLRNAARREDPDKLWRTLVAERGDYGRAPSPWYDRACKQCVFHHTSNGHINTRELLAKTTQPDNVQKFLKRVQAVIWNRCFLEVDVPGAENKLHGFGPSKAQPGDILCILFGCSVPVVLREREHENVGVYYLFIGEAYVYGIMDGEAVSALTDDELDNATKEFRVL